jgi:hypothetical protein
MKYAESVGITDGYVTNSEAQNFSREALLSAIISKQTNSPPPNKKYFPIPVIRSGLRR